jgi:predicted NBD/HSP70 family sugar kinase
MVVIPSRMGRLNKRALLGRLQSMRTASRASLAKSLGMSQPTAGKIVDELIEMGVVEEYSAAPPQENGNERAFEPPAKVGRPARMLRLNGTIGRFLCIQLGVTETSFASLPLAGAWEDHWKFHLPTPNSAPAWLKQLQKAARQLQQKRFWGVLVSVPGIVDEKKRQVLFSPNLHWTEGADLIRLIRNVWDSPMVLLQEERALALGHHAVAPSSDDFLLVDFGDGVGGTVLVGGKLYAHPLPLSGELGHTPVYGNERACGCGAVGCMETLLSTRGLLQSFAEHSPSETHTWPGFAKHVSQRGVAPWLGQSLDAAAIIVAGALNVLGLRHVVVTGGLNDLSPVVMQHFSEVVSRGAMWGRFGKIEVNTAPRRRIAGLVAVGIDRLVVPMAETEPRHETAAHAVR